jgi:hypothetical protein
VRLLNEAPLWLRLIVAAIATWRLSNLFVHEDGPLDVFRKLRDVLGAYILGDDDQPLTTLGRLFSCVWCLSVWIGAALTAISFSALWVLALPFALSAAAIWIDEYANDRLWPWHRE